ncbi:hypothetical protein [Fundicoccus culcitae]|uniref:ABC transporter permease n=1 Tax=Fundicoccus culcitae TaxID=2969821 RepID=A0ABY5P6Q2_9LACT|nr:hypothetical protein [Fundicoccus culcitae]UUX34417.1 hypothetical protein NRE15_01855 [Fundicoccus culcitae]
MSLFMFELKKTVKNGSVFLLLLFSTIISFANIQLNQSYHMTQQTMNNDIDAYPQMFLMTLGSVNRSAETSTAISPGMQHYYSIMNDPNYEPYITKFGYPIASLDLEFQYLQEAFKIDQINLTEDEIASFDYAHSVAEYLNNKGDVTDYQRDGVINYLLNGNQLIYGIIAIILICLIVLRLQIEDDKGREVFFRSLPLKRTHVLYSRMLLSVFLAFIYLMTVFLSTSLILRYYGIGFGDWQFPLRVLMPTLDSLPAFAVLIILLLIFIIKVFLFSSLTLFLLNILKKETIAIPIILSFTVFGTMFTYFFESLKTNWNPFYIDVNQQITGNMIANPNFQNVTRYVLDGNVLGMGQLSIWILIACVLLIITSKLYSNNQDDFSEQNIDLFKNNQSFNIQSLYQFEWLKLNRFMPIKHASPIFIIILISLLTMILLQDYQPKNTLLSSEIFDENYEEIVDGLNLRFQDLENQINDLDEDSDERAYLEASLASQQDVFDYYHTMNESISRRKAAFDQMDGSTFYRTFDQELQIFYNPRSIYSFVDQAYYYPRLEYYLNGDFPSGYGYELSRLRLEEMSNRNIRPIAGAGITLTPYDRARSIVNQIEDSVKYQLTDQSIMGIFVRLIHVYRLDLIILILVVIFCGAGYSLEGEAHQSLGWLYTLPYNRQTILWNKWRNASKMALLYVGITLLILCLFGLVLGGFGEWNIPMPFYLHVVDNPNNINLVSDSFQWIDLGVVFFSAVILLLLAVLFILTLSLLVSTFVKNTWLVSLTTLLICIVGYYISSSLSLGQYLPFTYLNIADTLDGSLIFSHILEKVDILTAMLTLLSWTIIIYGFSSLKIKFSRSI